MVMDKKFLHTINADIVKDSYIALNETLDKKVYFFSGGMSVQLFLPEHIHRVSSDLDLNGVIRLSNVEFKDVLTPGLNRLAEKGYFSEFKKQHYTFDINLENDEELLVLQFPRKSESSFQSTKKTLERELENVESVNYVGTDLNVISSEDIILHKLLRSKMFQKSYGITPINDVDLCKIGGMLTQHKKEFQLNAYNLSPEEISTRVAEIRLAADIYDIVALSIYKGINKEYFKEGLKSYDSLKHDKSLLIDYLQKINPNVFNKNN